MSTRPLTFPLYPRPISPRPTRFRVNIKPPPGVLGTEPGHAVVSNIQAGRVFMKTIYTFYLDAARIALQSILAHKLRAFLTLIGIIIGVASVVVVGAAISGLHTYVIEKVGKMLGTNHFMIARMAHQGQLSEEEWERRQRRHPHLD